MCGCYNDLGDERLRNERSFYRSSGDIISYRDDCSTGVFSFSDRSPDGDKWCGTAMKCKYRTVRGATDETMVESRPEDPSTSCCGPHVFTSVLLGVLACVLMTGGVFLAFHRWDPLWLIVSGVGVILVLIGSVLHCCKGAGGRATAGKGCCLPADLHHHNHVVLNGGSLTEQLLPLSNARSVSQLSLNMLPGYFPPMVTTYGIEQHSAVVQNINRIIQQQSSQSPPSVGSPGKNFILLSLPGNTPQANIQNLVATVYQLDGSVLAETSNPTDPPATTVSTAAASPPAQTNIPVLKNAEVQTCAAWPVPNTAKPIASAMPSTSNSTNERCCSPISTQTDDVAVAINLIDCLPDPICDNSCNSTLNEAPPSRLVDICEDRTEVTEPEVNRTSLVNTPDSSTNGLLEFHSIPQLPRISTSTLEEPLSEVLVDISEIVVDTSPTRTGSFTTQTSTESVNENISHSPTHTNEHSLPCAMNTVPANGAEMPALSATDSPGTHSEATSARLDLLGEDLQNDNSENSSLVDDADSLGRSSPPPSYEDVAFPRENPVSLAYGTL